MIIEILIVDKHVEDMITRFQSSLKILEYTKSKGMLNLLDDGYSKVLEGRTSFEEISRMVLDKIFFTLIEIRRNSKTNYNWNQFDLGGYIFSQK